MGKTSRAKKTWYHFTLKYLQKKVLKCKTSLPMIIAKARPYLAVKYLPIYILSFALGFYLWGPGHGFQKLMTWRVHQEQKKPSTVETLKRELSQLKKELEAQKAIQAQPAFDPSLFSRPALGQVTRGFEWAAVDNSWRLHPGVDIRLPAGSNVIAAAAGTVSEVKRTDNGEFTVSIEHGNGWKSIYANLANPQVQNGQEIIKGLIIGVSSHFTCDLKTPGFHFAIYHDGQPVNPELVIDGMDK